MSLYQLVCGKLPFEGDSMAQLMFRIATEPHTDILSVKPDVPPCLADIINKALAKPVGSVITAALKWPRRYVSVWQVCMEICMGKT